MFKGTCKIRRELQLFSWNYLHGICCMVVITSWNCLVNILSKRKKMFDSYVRAFSSQAIILHFNLWKSYLLRNNVMYELSYENTDAFFASVHMHVNKNEVWLRSYRQNLHCYPELSKDICSVAWDSSCGLKQTWRFWGLNIVIQSLFNAENKCVLF